MTNGKPLSHKVEQMTPEAIANLKQLVAGGTLGKIDSEHLRQLLEEREKAEEETSTGIVIDDSSYHRNGVSGIPFHICLFRDKSLDEADSPQQMLGVVFDTDRQEGYCAVFDFELLKKGEIRFMHNSWRGDRFEWRLREALEIGEDLE